MRSLNILKTPLALLVVAGIAWHFATHGDSGHVGILIDASRSVTRNCQGLRAMTQALMEGKSGLGKGSTLSLLVMGANAQNPQPRLALSLPIPVPPETLIGQDMESFEASKIDLLDQIEKTCQYAPASTSSPIYELVQQGLAHLKSNALSCGPNRACLLLLKSDLDEDALPELRAEIRKSESGSKAGIPFVLDGSFNNEYIRVVACGLSEIQSGSSMPLSSPEKRMRIWKQLFSHPELVSFQPFCR